MPGSQDVRSANNYLWKRVRKTVDSAIERFAIPCFLENEEEGSKVTLKRIDSFVVHTKSAGIHAKALNNLLLYLQGAYKRRSMSTH